VKEKKLCHIFKNRNTTCDTNINPARTNAIYVDNEKDRYDPANWSDSTKNTTTDMLIERGPLQALGNGLNFPKITDNQHFSGEFYVKKVINRKCVTSNMLIYFNFVSA
jgi:hypothetical protein